MGYFETIKTQASRVWERLTEPYASVTEPDVRHQSRFLSSLLLIAIVALLLLMVMFVGNADTVGTPGLWVSTCLMMIALAVTALHVSRQGRIQLASSLALALGIPGVFIPALMVGGQGGYTSLFYLVATTVYASVFLSIRATVVVTLAQLVGILALASRFPGISPAEVIAGPFSFNLFMASLVVLVTYYRQQAVRRRQGEVADSEERYRTITELISDYAYSMHVEADGTMRYEWITDEPLKRLSGYSIDDLDVNRDRKVGQRLFHPDDVEAVRHELARTLKGEATHAEHRIITRSGEVRWLHMYRRPYWDEKEQRVTRLLGVAQDITARKQAEIALRDSEERYRIITELISDYAFYYRINPDGTRIREWITDSFTRLTGYSADEIPGPTGDELIHPDDRATAEVDRQLVAQGENVSSDYRIFTKSGEQRWLGIHRRPAWDETHTRIIGTFGVAQDITARKVSEERYRIITELSSDYAYYYRINPDGTRTREWITDSFTRLTGYTADDVPAHTVTDMFHPDDKQRAAADRERVAQGEEVSEEYRIITKTGDHRWLGIRRRPVWDENHTRVIGYYGVSQDITTRKQAELALRENEERYRIITELISDYAYSLKIAPDGTPLHDWITEASFLRTTGYTHQELDEGEQVSLKLFHPDEEESLHAELETTLRNEATRGEHRIITKSGDTRWVHLFRRPYWDEKEGRVTRIYGVAQDVTARKLADLALKWSEERYRIISELISDYAYYFRIEPDGTRVREWVTDSLVRVTGYTPEELPAGAEVKMFHPDDLQNAAEDRKRILNGEYVSGEYRILRKDGEQRWLNIRRRPVWDEAHERVIGYYGVAQDITAGKQAEIQRMRMALEQEQRSMVNQFMQALSHDFRTLLATIETSRYLIEKLLDDAARAKVQPKLNTIQQSVTHLANQLENLHMVSSLTEPHPVRCDLNRLIHTLVTEQGFAARQKRVVIQFEPDAQVPPMQLDEVKMEQALRHLLTNALTYTAAEGQVTVQTRRDHNGVDIQVRDTGSGIQPEVLPRIFDPFYRGDEARTVNLGGVGLGLTIVKMTVEAHGGSVQVDSQAGAGTVFKIHLPFMIADAALVM